MKPLNTRGRIALLVILAALPALVLSMYMGMSERLQAQSHARDQLRRHALIAAAQVGRTIEGVQQLLSVVAAAPGPYVQDAKACHQFFARIVASSDGLYHAMGLHRPDGSIYCSSTAVESAEPSTSQRHFTLAAETRSFSIGGYQSAGPGGLKAVSFGIPVSDAEKNLRGVIFASLSLAKLDELTAATPLPPDAVLAILDHGGRVLVRHPGGIAELGEGSISSAVLEFMTGASGAVFEAPDEKGTVRVYASERVQSDPRSHGGLNVVVGVPPARLYSEATKATFGAVAGILIVLSLVLYAAWYGPEIALLRRLRALLAVTNHIRAGDLTARTRFPQSDEELCQLGHALDDMAQALQKRDADLKQALRELSEQVITDPLTRLNNRRYLWDFLSRDLIRARRAVLPVAGILFDIDHFKRFNDTWGHEAGDLVLKSVADVIRQNVRGSDIACRYGGEEFIIVLPEASRNVAVERAEQIRRDVERLELVLGQQKLARVTASFGVALYPTHADNAEALVRAADDALYRAKENGRNRVHVFETAPSPL